MADTIQNQHDLAELERSTERLKVFDELASIRMLRADLDAYGHVTAETRAQVYNEELTFVAESLNAPLRTTFNLEYTPDGLVNERGTPLLMALDRGVQAVKREAADDERLRFMARRALYEHQEGQLLEAMMSGQVDANTMVSVSPFCNEAYRLYGEDHKLFEGKGYNPDRLLAFIRVYKRADDNQLEMVSLSVDNSDLMAFRQVMAQIGVVIPEDDVSDNYLQYRALLSLDRASQNSLPERLIAGYDQAMQSIYGQEFRAGRPRQAEVEAWTFIESQPDLVNHYLDRLEQFAESQPDDLNTKKQLTYGFWAALKDRLKGSSMGSLYKAPIAPSSEVQRHALDMEISRAFSAAAARYERMIGCGGSIEAALLEAGNLLETSPANAMASIVGDKKEAWVWKPGVCRVEGCPTRPRRTEVGPCEVCRRCQHKFDQGKNPIAMYGKSSQN